MPAEWRLRRVGTPDSRVVRGDRRQRRIDATCLFPDAGSGPPPRRARERDGQATCSANTPERATVPDAAAQEPRSAEVETLILHARAVMYGGTEAELRLPASAQSLLDRTGPHMPWKRAIPAGAALGTPASQRQAARLLPALQVAPARGCADWRLAGSTRARCRRRRRADRRARRPHADSNTPLHPSSRARRCSQVGEAEGGG